VAFIPFGTAIVVCLPVAVETRLTTFVAATQIAPGASVASIGCRRAYRRALVPVSDSGHKGGAGGARNQSVPVRPSKPRPMFVGRAGTADIRQLRAPRA
jgi:hypothetical protein